MMKFNRDRHWGIERSLFGNVKKKERLGNA